MAQSNWKEKIGSILNICQAEVKKTTQIGQKMISAGQTNTCLKGNYILLGELVVNEINNGSLKWENEKAKELLLKIKECKENISQLEEQVNDIKFKDKDKDKMEH